ncbi:MAG: Fosmidomycin resistance protein [uncultured Rubrobacteraceae bacterium]|uniref:Fosmidomycin resistance protein n=1 Tax=uncultured Rubrobacteraceae bacterium TaxID=349277 RepID=A0A6J4QMV9_9ACTN|nr:MAG: Fosmidomycin resistance protein [uncultured Rubrobacteraceae bacterium]
MSAASKKGVDRRAMGVLSAGHLFTDLNQGAVAALLPFLISERGLSLAAAGALVFAATVSSSLVQPLFGIFSDRSPIPALMPLGVLLAGVGMALVGVAPSYPLIFASVVLSGIGVAAFHPEAARFANYVSGARRARGMSFFSVGGNAGFALGPIVATPLVLVFGLPGALFLALPAALMAGVMLVETPRMLRLAPDAAESRARRAEDAPERWGPFAVMVAVVAVRSFVYFGLVAFVASYYERVLGASAALGNVALTVMLASGAVGTLLMGPLADRFGRKAVLAWSMLALPPLVLAFASVGPYAGMALLALVGAATVGTFGVTVVMGQEYLPGRIGLAAGITMGLSIGLGGIGAPLLGLLADVGGLRTTMLAIAALPVLGFVLALTLPAKTAPPAGA